MRRPFAYAAFALALFSLAAGVLTPSEPFDANNLFVVDEANLVYEFDETGTAVPTLITGLGKLTGLMSGRDVAFGPDGGLYISDLDLDEVLVFASTGGGPVATLDAPGLDDPTAIAFGRFGGVFVGSEVSDSVFQFDSDGAFVREIGTDADLVNPRGIAFAPNGDLFVSSFGNNKVMEFAREGPLLNVRGTNLNSPWGLAFGRNGRLYVANNSSDDLSVFKVGGTKLTFEGRIGGAAGLQGPTDIAFGPDGNLYVANGDGSDVSVLDTNGNLLGSVGTGSSLSGPTGIAFSPKVQGAALRGTVYDATGRRKLSGAARLSWAPGSGQVMLLFPEAEDDFVEAFGERVLIFQGYGAGSATSTARQAFGGSLPGNTQGEGQSALHLEVRGKFDDETGVFDPGNFSGSLHRARRDGAIEMSVKRTKKLP